MKTHNAQMALAAAAVLSLCVVTVNPARAADSFTEAFTRGNGHIKFRYRIESVDQQYFEEDALASTLRTRLNFRTADWYGFGAFVEVDWIAKIFWDDYDQGAGNTPDKAQYPVVADPTGVFVNQAYLQWSNPEGTLVRGGRQVIIYDNARFVGNVGWRQHEQTFDAAAFRQQTDGGFDLQAAYVWQVNRIFGNDVPAGTNDNQTWLGNVAKDWADAGKLTAYYYDIDNDDIATFSTVTYGARWVGDVQLSSVGLRYVLEYAHQSDAHNNPVDYSANYYHADLSVTWPNVTPFIGFESLGGDDSRIGASFRTPLATLHAFNGWADVFLTTPPAGLVDIYGGLKGPMGSWNWQVIYHDFQAESGSQNFGNEIDAGVTYKFAKHYGLLFNLAVFNAASGSIYPDTTKLWAQFTADF
jgi:hypothetical protein